MRVRSLVLLVSAVVSTTVAPSLRAQEPSPQEYAQRWLDDCRDDHGGYRDSREVSCTVRHLGWRATGRAIVADAGPNGGVRAIGWDRDSVHVVVVISAHARTESAAEVLGEAVQIETRGTLRASHPNTSGRRESVSTSFTIYVPRRSDLEFDTENGPVGVRGVTGRMQLTTENGPVSLREVAGDVRARTANGPLDIVLVGTRWEGAGLDAESRNGPVRVELPAAYNARFETGTVNGPIEIDFPVTVQGPLSWRRIATDLGSGGPPIRAVTTNGPVIVRRR